MKPTPKAPLFGGRYKIFALVVVLAIMTAFALPKVPQWLAADADVAQNNTLS